MRVPYVIYTDYKCTPVSKSGLKVVKTEITYVHQACGFGYRIFGCDGESDGPVTTEVKIQWKYC